MKQELERLKELFRKYLDKVETAEDQEEMARLIMKNDRDDVANALLTMWPNENLREEDNNPERWQPIIDNILQQQFTETPVISIVKPRAFYQLPLVKYAAILLLLAIPAAIWFFKKNTPMKPGQPIEEMACGLVQPTAKDMKADNYIVRLKINNDKQTLSISPGWQYETRLPDGSKIILNTTSSITYPRAFDGDKREVEVTGQVYLDIAQNSRQPFYVKAGNTKLEALGTSFTVDAYPGQDSVYTMLVSGSLRAVKGNKSVLLKPGQQASMSTGTDTAPINITSVDIKREQLWKEGYFYFNKTSISATLQELGRWYKWKIEYGKNSYAKNKSFTATFCRRTSESDVLDELRSQGIPVKKLENKIIIAP